MDGRRHASQSRGMEDGRLPPFRHVGRRLSLVVPLLAGLFCALGTGVAAAQTSAEGELRLTPLQLQTGAPSYLEVAAGVYDIIGNGHRNQTAGASLEYRFGRKFYYVGPAVGIIGELNGGGMVYVGFYGDIPIGPVVVTPLAGFGAWRHGSRKDEDLGGWFEFRLSLEAAYQFANLSRLGLRFGHISNANTRRRNPGENDLMLTYALPLDF
jgi:lipid A 3-O-deacylase